MSRRDLADAADLTATSAAAAIRERRLTSEALVSACLDRIAEREPQLQAWAHLDPDYALAQARARDAELQSGRGVGPLHGVPIGVKDIFDTADFATENGSPIFAGRRPVKDAVCIAQLRLDRERLVCERVEVDAEGRTKELALEGTQLFARKALRVGARVHSSAPRGCGRGRG